MDSYAITPSADRKKRRGTAISPKLCYTQRKSCPISTTRFSARAPAQFYATNDVAALYYTYVYIPTSDLFPTYLLLATFPPLPFQLSSPFLVALRYNDDVETRESIKIKSKGNFVSQIFSVSFLFSSVFLEQASGTRQRAKETNKRGRATFTPVIYILVYCVHLSREKIN